MYYGNNLSVNKITRQKTFFATSLTFTVNIFIVFNALYNTIDDVQIELT